MGTFCKDEHFKTYVYRAEINVGNVHIQRELSIQDACSRVNGTISPLRVEL